LYVPSRIADNPHLDGEEYRQSLLHLPAVERERLLNGDWSVQERGQFHSEWLRYFVEVPTAAGSGDPRPTCQVELMEPGGRTLATIPEGECWRFITVDPAGTEAERPQASSGRSWAVVQVWDQPRRELSKFLLLRHQERGQPEY